MPKDYPLRFASQMRQHLRALRKQRGLTQAQLGALVGVSQARVAEIEANPGLVNLDQMLQLLAALGVTLSIEDGTPASPPAPVTARRNNPEGAAKTRRSAASDQPPSPSKRPAKPATQGILTSRPKKGSW